MFCAIRSPTTNCIFDGASDAYNALWFLLICSTLGLAIFATVRVSIVIRVIATILTCFWQWNSVNIFHFAAV